MVFDIRFSPARGVLSVHAQLIAHAGDQAGEREHGLSRRYAWPDSSYDNAGITCGLFHSLQIALYLYIVGDIIEPLGILLECLDSLAGREPLIMDRIVQALCNVVNCPFELG
jgi:hypothetical protein